MGTCGSCGGKKKTAAVTKVVKPIVKIKVSEAYGSKSGSKK